MNNTYYQYMQYQQCQEFLMHYGVKQRSGRYPYGSGERPYQSSGGRSGGFFRRRKEEKRKAEILKKKKEQVQKQKEEAEKKAKLMETKKEALTTGSAQDIQKLFSVMTTQEIEAAANRIRWMNEINKYATIEAKAKQGKDAFTKVDDFMGRLSKVNKWGETAIDSYRNIEIVANIIQKSAEKAEKKSKQQRKKKAS